ncbi:MAG: bile acid:sodium symporter [Deltaproteobacteria bacterium]|nr:bile acid:sodium symporter [Deltaproteobacteria bacterium]MBW2218096.1 bile acid:sodium symporter [Deltaproteobacteria bacterium]
MMTMIKKHWFLLGLFAVFSMTLLDNTEFVSLAGIWCKSHNGANTAIFIIFLISGLLLDAGQIKSGIKNVKSIFLSLILIFMAAPAIAVFFGMSSLDIGIKIGIILVAIMPTTLSSGVVMTGAAGGNMAGALVTTILANSLAVFTVPITLFILMGILGITTTASIDNSFIMAKIGLLVLLPLCLGLTARPNRKINPVIRRYSIHLQNLNLFLICGIVWMALSQSKPTIIENSGDIITVLICVAVFHGALLAVGGFIILAFQLKPGQRESTLLMGCQKTLPLSIILQISLFPQYGIALVVCVLHHLTQLIIDSFVVAKLKKAASSN